jgi:hypothetical protein
MDMFYFPVDNSAGWTCFILPVDNSAGKPGGYVSFFRIGIGGGKWLRVAVHKTIAQKPLQKKRGQQVKAGIQRDHQKRVQQFAVRRGEIPALQARQK